MKFELPSLPYAKGALEPHISARTIDFHYDKHHRGYLTKLEKAIEGKPIAEKSLEEIIRESQGTVFNLAAQVWNHTFYWSSMSPKGGGGPHGDLASALDRAFGSADDFKRRFAEAANGEFGSGWAWLVLDRSKKLRVIATDDAENPLQTGETPLLTIDVWEHAYYLDYQHQRPSYVKGFLDHLINWEFAADNYRRASAGDAR